MAPKLYLAEASPPVRAVLMTAKAIKLELEQIEVNVLEKEQLQPEYIKMNPQHTVPTLVDDDGFIIWDSHAIVVYLINKYAPNSPLLPKDIKQRAVLDQRLHFDSGVIFPNLIKLARPIIFESKKTIDEENKTAVNGIYELLEKFLEKNQWIAGDNLTVADYSIITSLSSVNLLVKVDPSKYPKLTAWVQRMQSLPEYQVNLKGLDLLKDRFKDVSL